MKTMKLLVPAALILLLAGQAAAQSQEELERREAAAAEAERASAEAREGDIEKELKEQERIIAEASRRIAKLTQERLPRLQEYAARQMEYWADGRPRIGVTVGESQDGGPVEGVIVTAVTPGTAAKEAGLRSGDIITAINGESLSAASSKEANMKIFDFMKGVEEGDILDIEYLRDGKVGRVEVEPRPVEMHAFEFEMPEMHISPDMAQKWKEKFVFAWPGSVWADMELAELSAGLSKYFGTDDGVLVVSAPEADALQLEDGDVILRIDGREPTSVEQTLRILGSYEPGESLKLEIMREQRQRTLDIRIPDNTRSMFWAPAPAPRPAVAPRPPAAPHPQVHKT